MSKSVEENAQAMSSKASLAKLNEAVFSAEEQEKLRLKIEEFSQRRMDLRQAFYTPPPPIDFVLPGMVAGTVGLLVGAGSAGKSMWAVQVGMSIAAGEDGFGLLGSDMPAGKVVYLCAEDQESVLHHRLHNMAQILRRNERKGEAFLDRVAENFHVLPVYGLGLTIEHRGDKWWEKSWWQAAEYCRGARLIIVDTLIRFSGGRSENDNVEMGVMMNAVEETVAKTGSSFLLLHHVGKAAARDGSAGGDQTAVRGASALTDNARWQANLQTMTPSEAARRGIESTEERRSWVSWEPTKTNYGPAQDTVWLHRGDHGILERNDPPVVENNARGAVPNGPGRF